MSVRILASTYQSAAAWRRPGVYTLGTVAILLLTLAVARLAIATPTRAAYPGLNGRLSFTSHRDNNNEIYSMNADGSDVQRLTNNALDDDGAVWSPDGTKIAFGRQAQGSKYGVWVMNADGNDAHQLSPADADDATPSWSPDGSKLVFESFRTNEFEIWVMNVDGSGASNLTNNPGSWDNGPAWSPDGTKIAFYSYRDGNAEIYVMNSDGSNQTRLTNNSVFDGAPKWSSDGSRIYWWSGGGQMRSMKADGSDQQVIDVSAASSFGSQPAPSANGALTAFQGDNGIYTMNTDGTNIMHVQGTTSDDFRPDWQPLAAPPPTDTPSPAPSSTSSATPTGTPTPTPTPSATPSPTPLPSPTGSAIAGDADCDGDADAVDALHVLRNVAGLSNTADCLANANVKCDDGMTAVDALLILRYVAHLSVDLPAACPAVGSIMP